MSAGAGRHPQPINPLAAIATPGATKTSTSSSHRPDLYCPDCGGNSVFEEYVIGSIVCHNCGHVLEETIFEGSEHADENSGKRMHSHGLVPVSSIGRPLQPTHDPRAGHHGHHHKPSASESRKAYRGKRFEQMRQYLAAAGRLNNLTPSDVSRAYFLWKYVMSIQPFMFWNPAARAALACLYIASKESKKGLSLVEVAVRAEISPYKIGATYKLVKRILFKHEILDFNSASYNTEEDPWIMLDRILSIGSTNSIQRGDMDKLPNEIRNAFGFNLDNEKRTSCLRGLLSSAQKCMTIAMDSGLVTGRQQQALVAACLVIAVEVRLALTKPCDELLEFAVITFSSAHKTVNNRYKELKQCMLVWARRLPFVKDASKIKAAKLVYYMDDVFKYFGHLNQQNQQLWTILDKSESAASNGGNYEDGNDRLGPGEYMTEKDLELEQELEKDGTIWALDSDDDNQEVGDHVNGTEITHLEQVSGVPSIERLHPPAYGAKLKQERRRLEYLEIAKMVDINSHPSYSWTEQHDVRGLSRINWTRSLLLLGTRTEQELIEATDNTLEYWVCSDHAKMSNPNLPRSREELDSADLTAEDLDEQEFKQYLRTPSETEAVLRVQGHLYAWTKESTKQTARSAKPKRPRESEYGRSQSSSELPIQGSKRVRSSKLNLEALSDIEDEKEQKGQKKREDEEDEDAAVETWYDDRGGDNGIQEDVDTYDEQGDFDDYDDGYE